MARSTRSSRAHLDVSREAGLGRLSFISIVAGLLTAYGSFAVVASVVGAILSALDLTTDFRSNEWTGSGAVAAIASAVVLLLAYLFGGYVAGRMARRASVLHGVAVFIGSLAIAAVVGGLVGWLSDDDRLRENLRSIGVPTTTDQVSGVAVTGVIVSLAAILVGSVVGSVLGERWHTKLARRAADPDVGPAADLRRRALEEVRTRQDRLDHDTLVRSDILHSAPPAADDPASGDSASTNEVSDRARQQL